MPRTRAAGSGPKSILKRPRKSWSEWFSDLWQPPPPEAKAIARPEKPVHVPRRNPWWVLDLWRGPWLVGTSRRRRQAAGGAYMSDIEYSCLASEADKLIPLTPGAGPDGIRLKGSGALSTWDELEYDTSRRGYATDLSPAVCSRIRDSVSRQMNAD